MKTYSREKLYPLSLPNPENSEFWVHVILPLISPKLYRKLGESSNLDEYSESKKIYEEFFLQLCSQQIIHFDTLCYVDPVQEDFTNLQLKHNDMVSKF